MDFSVIGLALFFWVVVELVQRLRKRSPRTSMKAGAWWAVAVASLSLYGMAPQDKGLNYFGILLVLNVVWVFAVYWTRVGLGKLIFRKQEAS